MISRALLCLINAAMMIFVSITSFMLQPVPFSYSLLEFPANF